MADQPQWYKSLVNWMFCGLGSTVGVILLGLFYHEMRLTRLEENKENGQQVLVEIKGELKTLNSSMMTLQREFDRTFGAAK